MPRNYPESNYYISPKARYLLLCFLATTDDKKKFEKAYYKLTTSKGDHKEIWLDTKFVTTSTFSKRKPKEVKE